MSNRDKGNTGSQKDTQLEFQMNPNGHADSVESRRDANGITLFSDQELDQWLADEGMFINESDKHSHHLTPIRTDNEETSMLIEDPLAHRALAQRTQPSRSYAVDETDLPEQEYQEKPSNAPENIFAPIDGFSQSHSSNPGWRPATPNTVHPAAQHDSLTIDVRVVSNGPYIECMHDLGSSASYTAQVFAAAHHLDQSSIDILTNKIRQQRKTYQKHFVPAAQAPLANSENKTKKPQKPTASRTLTWPGPSTSITPATPPTALLDTLPALQVPFSQLARQLNVSPRDMSTVVQRPTAERVAEVEKRKNKGAPRPQNAFMLYRQAYACVSKVWTPMIDNQQNVSRIMGVSWRMEPSEVRDHFTELAEIEKRMHEVAFVGYKYQPEVNKRKRDLELGLQTMGEN